MDLSPAPPPPAPGPSPSKTPFSTVVRLKDCWLIACQSGELRERPLARMIQGTPMVLFRSEDGRATALLDRCPHRNVPLSVGRVAAGQLECSYHGWRFDAAGACRAVPGLCNGEADVRARRVARYPVMEQDGFVWLYTTAEAEAPTPPFRFPHLDNARYSTVRREFEVESTVHAMVENTLDVPHTAYLHGGLFRTAKKKNEIEVIIRRSPHGVEAQYLGEPRPTGLAGRLLAPQGGVVEHFDRFLLPSIAQVEYRLGEKTHLVATSVMTPVTDFKTRIYAVVTFSAPVPHWLLRPVVTPVATHIFRQDARILKLQTETLQHFGHESFASTELDTIGPAALRLMRQAEKGQLPTETSEQRVRMLV